MSNPKMRVILVEPQNMLRRLYERMMRDTKEIELLLATGSTQEVVRFLEEEGEPQVSAIVISAQLVFPKGEEVGTPDFLSFVKHMYPTIPVVLLAGRHPTPELEEEEMFRAIKRGVRAYVPSDREPDDLIVILQEVASGQYSIDEFVLQRPALTKKIVRYFSDLQEQGGPDLSPFAPLSKREKQILELIGNKGYSNKEVARELSISDQTVKNHMSSIMRKLNVNDRTQAVVTAMQNKWISVEPSKGGSRG